MVYDCSPLVVLADFLSVTPLEVYQVCLFRLEIVLSIVLGISTEFPNFLQMVSWDLDVVVALFSLLTPVRLDPMNICMAYLFDGGRTLLYHQPFPLFVCSHIYGDTYSDL